MNKKILITGVTGFLGNRLRELLKVRYQILGISKTREEPGIYKIDIRDHKNFERIELERLDAIIHTAACVDPRNSLNNAKKNLDTNVLGLLNLLNFAKEKKVRKIIYISSIAVYGNLNRGIINEESLKQPTSYYGMSKYLAENILQDFCGKNGISYAIFRPSSIYGPGTRHKTVIMTFIEQATQRGELRIFGTGKRTQDFLYVDDAVEAVRLAIASKDSVLCNIGSGIKTDMRQLAKTVSKVFSAGKCKIVFDESGEEDNNNFTYDITRAKAVLGFSPKYNLEQGLFALREYREKTSKSQ